jgi:prefoldin subunit 5
MIGTSEAADAGSLGKFLSGLIARGVVRGTAHSMDGSAYTPNVPSKSYTPNVLTVDQLVRCLKEASMLDEQSDPLERKRTELQSAGKEVDQLKDQLDIKRAAVNRASQISVDRFNAEIDRYNATVNRLKSQEEHFNLLVSVHNGNVNRFNAECAKQYYADDMESARKLAGI